MADQPSSGGLVKAFLPGLVLGLVVGAFAGAFLGPMISNPPEPVSPSRGGVPVIIPPPAGTFDERAPQKPEAEAEKKTPDPAQPDAKSTPPQDVPKSPDSKPAEAPAAAPK